MGDKAWGVIMDEMDHEAKNLPTKFELDDFLKSHQQQVANLFAEIERLNAELAKALAQSGYAAKSTGRPAELAEDSEGQGGGR